MSVAIGVIVREEDMEEEAVVHMLVLEVEVLCVIGADRVLIMDGHTVQSMIDIMDHLTIGNVALTMGDIQGK